MTTTAPPLPYNVPQSPCCNCGAANDLTLVDTPLKKTRFMILAGTEIQFSLALPYCKRCAKTATRFPAGTGKKLMIAFAIFWILLLIIMLLPFQLANLLPGVWLPVVVFAVSVALTYGFYGIQKPKPPQTSVSQPVTLSAVKQKFSGEISGVTLGFSNADFAEQFEAINRDNLSPIELTVTLLR